MLGLKIRLRVTFLRTWDNMPKKITIVKSKIFKHIFFGFVLNIIIDPNNGNCQIVHI